MGFVERLIQEKASAALKKQQQGEQLRQQRETAEKAKLQAETTEKERRAQRRQQAESFRKECGVGLLVAELGRFLASEMVPGTVYDRTDRAPSPRKVGEIFKGVSKGPDYEITPPPYLAWDPVIEISYPSIPPTDQDSIFDMAIWDMKYLGSRSKGGKYWEEAEQKFLAVETRPDGNVVFHARNNVTKSGREWGTNKAILDKALKEAFYNPGIHKFQYRHHEAWYEPS